jgi:hypothetical protein
MKRDNKIAVDGDSTTRRNTDTSESVPRKLPVPQINQEFMRTIMRAGQSSDRNQLPDSQKAQHRSVK